jgi:succinoglycan biosynthesis transport protein ExoP
VDAGQTQGWSSNIARMSNSAENPLEMLREYLGTVRHYVCWIGMGTLVLSICGISLIAKLPDQYKATTTILVDPQKVPEKYVSSTVAEDPSSRLAVISQDVLSTTHLQHVIEQFHLYGKNPNSRDQAIEMMRRNITIEVKGGVGLSAFTITYVGRDPRTVAAVTNQLAGSFIADNVETREQLTEGTTEFLGSQLERARHNLEEQERKLREFKMQHLGEMPEQQQSNLQVLAQLQANFQANSDALNRLDIQRMMLLRTERTGTGTGTVPSSQRGRLESERLELEQKLLDLKRTYTTNYPDVIEAERRLDRVKAQLKALPPDPDPASEKLVNSSGEDVQLVVLDKEKKRLEEAQKRLLQQIHIYQAKVEAAPTREYQVTDLTRNYEVSKNNYQSLLDKNFSAQMAADLEKKQKAERFTILDPAQVPERPYKPKRLPMMIGAILISLCMSVGLAIGKDTIDPSVKSETEIKSLLPPNVPLLVAIPTIVTPEEQRRHRLFLIAGIAIAVLACLAEAGFLWKVHPYL